VTIDLFLMPYDAAQRSIRMGRGPEHLVEAGIRDSLQSRGYEVHAHTIDSDVDVPSEIMVAVDLARGLAERVGASRRNGHFPLVLAGRCMSALGAVAGLGSDRTGVVWFDSHGDFNTPETSRSGMLDGMAGAVIAGRCWSGVAATIPGFVPVSESRYVLVGARDLDPAEAELLESSAITLIPSDELRAGGPHLAADSLSDTSEVYVHVDLDVLDPDRVGRANPYAAPGGLDVSDVVAVVGAVADRYDIAAATLSAYDPSFDGDGRVAEAAMAIANEIVRCASARTA
jgi:arginase